MSSVSSYHLVFSFASSMSVFSENILFFFLEIKIDKLVFFAYFIYRLREVIFKTSAHPKMIQIV